MENQTASELLKQLILEKEAEQKLEGVELRNQFLETYDSLKPVNIIKNTLKGIVNDPELKNSLADTAIGYAAGLLAKKITVGKSSGPVKNILGSMVQTIVSKIVANNAGGIKSLGSMILEKIIHKTEPSEKA